MRICSIIYGFFLIIGFTGCGTPNGLDNLNVATGVVTLDGEPLTGASITLVPISGTGRGAGATSDEKGVFKFQTLQANDGVADGDYRVTVTKRYVENPYTEEESRLMSESGKRHKDVFGADRPEPTTVNEVPEKYALPTSSGLTLTIAGATKDLKLELFSE